MTSSLQDRKSIIYALIVVAFWSTTATAFKIGLQHAQPAQLVLLATASSLLVFAIFAAFTGKMRKLFKFDKQTLLRSAILGALNPFIYYIVLLKGYSLLPAQIAQPVNMIWPIVLVLLSVPVLKHKIGWRSMIALFISFFGVVLISSKGQFATFGDTNVYGILLCVLSSVIWSVYWLAGVKDGRDEVVKLFQNFLFAFVYLIVYTSVFTPFESLSVKALLSGAYIGIFETGVSFILWAKAMSYSTKSSKIANLVYLAPFSSLIFIHFILGEEIYYSTLLGMLFLISGILFQQTEKIKQIETQE
jgi:drug/metabolite transporter (DMT)-like permease